MLTGKKTYIFATLLGIATAAYALGWIDQILFEAIAGFLGAGGLAGLRAAIK